MVEDLHPVTVQRIGLAVKASHGCGRLLPLRIDGSGDTAFVVWWDRARHVVAAGSERGMQLLLPALEREYVRQQEEFAVQHGAVVGV